MTFTWTTIHVRDLDQSLAFIVNVPHNRVITTLSETEMKDSIFTNIDGAVFL